MAYRMWSSRPSRWLSSRKSAPARPRTAILFVSCPAVLCGNAAVRAFAICELTSIVDDSSMTGNAPRRRSARAQSRATPPAALPPAQRRTPGDARRGRVAPPRLCAGCVRAIQSDEFRRRTLTPRSKHYPAQRPVRHRPRPGHQRPGLSHPRSARTLRRSACPDPADRAVTREVC